MMPRPSQVGQVSENESTSPPETRFRVICMIPSGPISNTWDLVLSMREGLPHRVLDLALVLLQQEVDEVDHDDAADVSQPQLASDLAGRFEVRRQHRLLEVGLADGLAGVHVDDRHRLGLLDDQVAARGEPDLPVERLVDLLDDPVLLEGGQGAVDGA